MQFNVQHVKITLDSYCNLAQLYSMGHGMVTRKEGLNSYADMTIYARPS